jgi:hypothetical protein
MILGQIVRTMVISATLLAAAPAFACQTTSAQVKGLIGGSSFKNGICFVVVFVESVKRPKMCAMNVQIESEIEVETGLSERNCPQDEGPVNGVITSYGSRTVFSSGKIDMKEAGTF